MTSCGLFVEDFEAPRGAEVGGGRKTTDNNCSLEVGIIQQQLLFDDESH